MGILLRESRGSNTNCASQNRELGRWKSIDTRAIDKRICKLKGMIKREKPFLGGFGRFSTSFFRGNPLFLQSLLLAQATAKAVTKPHLSFPLSKIYSFILSFDLPLLAVSAIYRLLVGKRVHPSRSVEFCHAIGLGAP